MAKIFPSLSFIDLIFIIKLFPTEKIYFPIQVYSLFLLAQIYN